MAVKAVIFVIQLLRSMKVSVELIVTVRVQNIGAIVMANNITITSHIKNVDIRYKYLNAFVEDLVIEIIFVKTTENDSNILTKNLSAELHEEH